MQKLSLLMIILIFSLVACGGEEPAQLEGANRQGNSPTATPAPADNTASDTNTAPTASDTLVFAEVAPVVANDFTMPTVEALDGTLIFVQGNMRSASRAEGDGGKIFFANFDGGQPERIVDRVFAPSVALSANQEYLVYAAADGRRWWNYALNIATRETVQIARLQSQFGFVNGWSPDGQWVVITNPPPVGQGQILAKLDGTVSIELGVVGTFWTMDNQVLLINFNADAAPTFELLDPNTAERTAVELTVQPDFTDPLWQLQAAEQFAAQGIILAETLSATGIFAFGVNFLSAEETLTVQRDNPQQAFGVDAPVFCDGWDILRNGEPFYSIENTALISDIQTHEGDFYFLRWYMQGCTLSLDSLNVELVRHSAEGDTTVLQSAVYAGDDINMSFLRSTNGAKYTLSPDGQYVAWIEGTLAARTSTLHVMAITSGESLKLMEWGSSNNNTFLSHEVFSAVFWVE